MMKRREKGTLVELPADEEAVIRARHARGGPDAPLLENHGPYDVVLTDEEAAAERARRAAEVPAIPDVTAWQMRAELLARGTLEEAEALIAKHGGELQIRWEYDPVLRRGMWDALGAPSYVDDLFRAAAVRE